LKPITAVRILFFAAALTPAAALAYGFYRFSYAGDFNALTANPGDYITDQTGTWALGCLAASLCVTPIRRLTGWNEIIKLRRMLGLFAFFYATLHMLTWVVFVHYFECLHDRRRGQAPLHHRRHDHVPDPAGARVTSTILKKQARSPVGQAPSSRPWPRPAARCISGNW
jgi:DMSO/TMAO reductase YedYZ heme-binding membrane subunit